MSRPHVVLVTATVVALLAAACQSGSAPMASKVVPMGTLNGSGISGQATLTDLGNGRTRVDVNVNGAGNLDMPSHLHPGTCAAFVPQPKYPLENVKNGSASTEIPAALRQLLEQPNVVMTHKSNNEMAVYTSCGDIS
jgi:hypothetical protein